jgi:disulfide bond formation protein DsbB
MTDNNPDHTNKKNKMDFFNFLLEVFGWIRIVASPLLIGVLIGFGVYSSKPDKIRLIIAIVIASIGLIIGIIWATKVWRKGSTMDYTTISSHDFDNYDKEKE